eukprot:TRINITY_DN2709_c0_g1_i1.p1 TRINITY_DN2709_c0_g1~~TRINITY_DN2709_c0_g1_i1.p1  ORF type:complete len:510 (+),score=110.76 TRINITY_DN2709_c0_g1_i1:169-1698(+)
MSVLPRRLLPSTFRIFLPVPYLRRYHPYHPRSRYPDVVLGSSERARGRAPSSNHHIETLRRFGTIVPPPQQRQDHNQEQQQHMEYDDTMSLSDEEQALYTSLPPLPLFYNKKNQLIVLKNAVSEQNKTRCPISMVNGSGGQESEGRVKLEAVLLDGGGAVCGDNDTKAATQGVGSLHISSSTPSTSASSTPTTSTPASSTPASSTPASSTPTSASSSSSSSSPTSSSLSFALDYFAHRNSPPSQQLKLGDWLIHSPSIPSTQILVQRWLSSFPPSLVCVADIQTSGKGRGDNVWESPLGSLAFTFKCHEKVGTKLPFLQYVVSLAVVLAARTLAGVPARSGASGLDVRLKWPNDIYADGKKIGGVLCQSSYFQGRFDVTIGVGINLTNDLPTTSLKHEMAKCDGEAADRLTRPKMLAEFITQFSNLMKTFGDVGFAPLQPLYLDAWMHSDQEVVVQHEDGTSSAVTIKGISESGFLLGIDDQGERVELHSDGNRLDFFKGLIRRKLPVP